MKLLLAPILFMVGGCFLEPTPKPITTVMVKEGQLIIFGPITEDAADSTLAADGRYGEVLIMSAGGHSQSAMKIAEAIRKNNAVVTVRRYCLSACAAYILAAAREVRIDAGVLIGFHLSPLAMERGAKMLEANSEAKGRVVARVREDAEDTRKAYRSWRVDIGLLECLDQSLAPTSFLFGKSPFTGELALGAQTESRAVWVHPAALTSFGFAIVTDSKYSFEAAVAYGRDRFRREAEAAIVASELTCNSAQLKSE